MMFPWPDSGGTDLSGYTCLREFNKCHEPGGKPEGGQFTVSGQGRCLGTEARVHARRTFQNQADLAKVLDPRGLDARKKAKEFIKHPEADIPEYMKKDIKTAKRTDAAIVVGMKPHASGRGGQAGMATRTVLLDPHASETKGERLTTLRHELGHIDMTPLGSGRSVIGGLTISDKMAEEVRAWKNAIRNSGGKLNYRSMEAALASYMANEPAALDYHVRLGGRGDPLPVQRKAAGLTLTEKHVMPVMRRYAERIRRALRGSPAREARSRPKGLRRRRFGLRRRQYREET